MPTTLITGANRGLGLEFVKQYSADNWRILACCRQPEEADELTSLAANSDGKVTVHQLDVNDFNRIDLLASELAGESIDLLLNNAGVYGNKQSFGGVDYEEWRRVLHTNTLAPLKLTEAFVDHVAKSEKKLIVIITSKMGSVDDNTSGGHYIYRSSKAAVNMVGRSLSHDLKDRGVTSIVLHPGWVQTDMGGTNAPLKIEDSIRQMKETIGRLTLEDSGKFFNFDGAILPW